MKAQLAAALTFAALAAVSVRGDDAEEDYVANVEFVANLTDKNFNEYTESQDLVVMFFYSKGCGACKQLKPYFYDACKRLAEREEGAISCARIDTDKHKTTHKACGITSYPTVKVMRNGHRADWVGGMSRNEGLDDRIYDYMMNQVGPSSQEIESAQEVKDTFKKKKMTTPAVLGYFSTKTSIDYKYFMQVAHTFRNSFDFYHVSDTNALEQLGYYNKGGAVSIYRPWAEKFKVAYKGLIFKSRLQDFVVEHMLPPVGWADYDLIKVYEMRGLPIVRGLVWEDFRDTQEEPMRAQLMPLAKKYAGELMFLVMGEGSHSQMDKTLLQKNGQIVIFDQNDSKKKFVYTPSVDGDLDEWVEKAVRKELKVTVKSEAPHPKAGKGEVQQVTGNTFDLYVMDPTKDVMIEFYAPWCGHCKKFSPIYDELAEALRDEENVLITKIDQTANENTHKAYKAGGFPTIMWASTKDKANPVKYEGAREVEDIVAWIKENAAVKLTSLSDEL